MADWRRALGTHGERLAERHLVARGYEVLERNFRTRHGELDLVARNDRCLVVCEVKTRVVAGGGTGPFGPLTAVGPRKRGQLRRMAREWLRRRPDGGAPRPREIRFDAIGISLSPEGRLLALEHVEEAF